VKDPLERVLKLVAEGRLTADEAAPILDALSAREAPDAKPDGPAPAAETTSSAPSGGERSGPKFARIQVMESGRRVVDLRVPTSLGRFALGRVPGLSAEQISELQRAISTGLVGPLLEVEDTDGDGVRIVLE
jgi:SHOCT-like protein